MLLFVKNMCSNKYNHVLLVYMTHRTGTNTLSYQWWLRDCDLQLNYFGNLQKYSRRIQETGN